MNDYFNSIHTILTGIMNEQEEKLDQAATVMEAAVESGCSLYLFGASHAALSLKTPSTVQVDSLFTIQFLARHSC